MLKVKTSLQSNDTFDNLGQIMVELTEVNYNQIVEYVLPIIMEKLYQSMNSDKKMQTNSLLMSIVELLYQEKSLTVDAVKSAIQVFPTSIKEELIQTIIKSPQIHEMISKQLTPYGLSLGCVEIIDESITGERL